MATVSLSIKKNELKKIVIGAKPDDKEVDRPWSLDLIEKFFAMPAGEEAQDAEDFLQRSIPREDLEAIVFQCGRNPDDGFAIIELLEFFVDEYIDEKDKPCGEFYLMLVLGRTLKTNVQD